VNYPGGKHKEAKPAGVLPTTTLVGLADRFLKRPGLSAELAQGRGALPEAPFATGAVPTPLLATTII